jgi:hypothetical protein
MIKCKKVYIAGAVSDNPNYKRQFNAARDLILASGKIPIDTSWMPLGLDYEDYMHVSFACIDIADEVYFMHNRIDSNGAKRELDHCKKLGKPILLKLADL